MAKITDWETNPEFIMAKCMALYEVITNESSTKNIDCESVIKHSIYLLGIIGLNFGCFQYNFIPAAKSGLVSDALKISILNFQSTELVPDARDYILHDSTNGTTEKVGRLLMESRRSIGSGYTQKEYLGAMANVHFLRANNDGDDESVLSILSHNTYYNKKQGNARALHSVRSLIRR